MNCSAFKNRISEYIDGEAKPGLRTHMERHVENCADCAELMRDMVGVTDRLSRLPRLQPSAGFDFALRTRLSMEMTRGERRWDRLRSAIRPSFPRTVYAAAAAVVIAAGSVLFVGTDSTIPTPFLAADSVDIRPLPPVEVAAVSVERGALKRLSEEESYTLSERHFRTVQPIRSNAMRRRSSVQRVAVRF
jgi:anti-sigma factor RsiW